MSEHDLLCYQKSLLDCVESLFVSLKSQDYWAMETVWFPPILLYKDGSLSSRFPAEIPWTVRVSRSDLSDSAISIAKHIWKVRCHCSWIL